MNIKVKNRKMDLMQPSAFFVYCMGMDSILVCARGGGMHRFFFLVFFFNFASEQAHFKKTKQNFGILLLLKISCFSMEYSMFIQSKNRSILPWE